MGSGEPRAPRWLARHHREFRADWTVAVRSAGGLARWTTLSPHVPSFEAYRSFNAGRVRRKQFVTDVYLRPRKILDNFSRLYPDAWKQVDGFRRVTLFTRRKGDICEVG